MWAVRLVRFFAGSELRTDLPDATNGASYTGVFVNAREDARASRPHHLICDQARPPDPVDVDASTVISEHSATEEAPTKTTTGVSDVSGYKTVVFEVELEVGQQEQSE
jgi:hypothetical protein